jgi:hypothetical protein
MKIRRSGMASSNGAVVATRFTTIYVCQASVTHLARQPDD